MNLAQIATYVLLVLLLSPAAAFGQPSFAAERLIVKLSRQASATLAQAGSTGGQTTRGLLDRSSVNTLLPEIGSVESVKGVFGSPPTNNALIKLGRDEARLDQVYLIELNDGQDPVHLANVLSKNSNVEYAQPDYHISASTLPNDTYVDPDQNGVWSTAAWQQNFEDLWGLKAMRATEAWTSPGCSGNCQGEGVLVAVIDTGVDYNHPDIWDNIWVNPLVVSDRNNDQSIDLDDLDQNSNQRIDPEEYTPGMFGRGFIGEQNPYDRNGHGSHVAGTIAAVSNNGIGIAGVAPKSKIIPIKGLGSTGGGYTTVLADALRFAADLGARVINNSWGCSHSCPSNPLIEDAVRYAHQQNTVVIFAAGNSNEDANLYSPNFMGEVISVAAVTHLDEKAYFSNWGSVIDLAAPGGGQFSEHTSYPAYSVLSLASEISSIRDEIPEVGVGTDYLRLAGTSMAAPHIAGAAALLLSRHPEYGPAEVKSALRMSSEPVAAEDDEYLGQGRPNLVAALQLADLPPHAELDTRGTMQGTIDLRGTAGVNPFLAYRLHIRQKGSPNWQFLRASSQSVESGVLLENFDTTRLPDGDYTLRLLVEALNGGFVETRSPVRIDNTAIFFPLHNDIIRKGDTIEITGEIIGDYTAYRLEFGAGNHPDAWYDFGIATTHKGAGTGYRGILGTWDTGGEFPTDAQLGRFYTLRLTVERAGSSAHEFTYLLYLDETLHPGWPQHISSERDIIPTTGAVITADLNSDGSKEIVVFAFDYSLQSSVLSAYQANGSLLWSRNVEGQIIEHPVAADLDGDGRLELIIGVNVRGETRRGRIHVYTGEGAPYGSQWETLSLDRVRALSVADFDQDGIDELLVRTWKETLFSPITDWIYIFNSRAVAEQQFEIPTDAVSNFLMFPATGQLDQDPELELVFVINRSRIAAYNLDGTLLPGWPKTVDGFLGAAPSVGDLDNDQLDEIIVGVAVDAGAGGGLMVFEQNGENRAGWPILEGKDFFYASPALGDLDGDGNPEIVVATADGDRELYAVDASGNILPGWPVHVVSLFDRNRSASIGDLNSDGVADVLFASGGFYDPLYSYNELDSVGGIYAWNADGSPIDLNPHSRRDNIFTELTGGTFMTIDDLEGDDLLDIVAAQFNSHVIVPDLVSPKQRVTLSVWSFPETFSNSTTPWPNTRGDAGRSGRFDSYAGDFDKDGIPDELDDDDDNDGLSDLDELNIYGTNPRSADSDRDGVSDADELSQRSDPGDRGSSIQPLGKQLCAEWNGFFGGRMWNVLEQINMGEEFRSVESSLFDIFGFPRSTERLFLEVGKQLDLLVHDMPGFEPQTYGKVCSTYSGHTGSLDGRMLYYLPNVEPSGAISDFQFAFAMPFSNGIRGPQYVSFNTYPPGFAPGDQQNFVANWLQVNNLSDKPQSGVLYFYSQSGELLSTEPVTIGAGERRDFSAHSFGPSLVGHAEFFPFDYGAAFQLRNVRYVYDNPGTKNSFDTAFQIEAAVGSGRLLSAPVDTRNGGTAVVELTNTTNGSVSLELAIHRSTGEWVTTIPLQLAPHASHHAIIDSHLPNDAGAVWLRTDIAASVIAVVMQYGRGADGGVKFMYGVRAVEALGEVLRGSYNTYLNQQSELWVVNPGSQTQEFSLSMRRYDGGMPLAGLKVRVPGYGISIVRLNDFELPDAYGIATIIPDTGNSLSAWLLRRRSDEYVVVTPVRQ